MKCLLCGQTMKAVLTFSSLLLLKNDDSCLLRGLEKKTAQTV